MSIEHSLYRYIRPLLPAVLVLLLLTVLSCRRTPDSVLRSMDRAEALMEEHPDSALSILLDVDTADLHGAPDRARRALLMSMALDKNYIDTTDFSVLRPALDYYETHGTPDQRLKTRYYQGRIYMNRGEDDAALNALLRAAEDSASATDAGALGRLFQAQGALYYRQDDIWNFIRADQRALKYYVTANDTVGADIMMTNILDGACLVNDTILGKKMLPYVTKMSLRDGQEDSYPMATVIIAHYSFDTDNELRKTLPHLEYTADRFSNSNPSINYNLALCYDRIGEYEKALNLIESVEFKDSANYSLTAKLKFNAIDGRIYSHNNKTEEALRAYIDFTNNSTRQYDYMLNSGVLSTKDHYEAEIKSIKKSADYSRQMLIGFIIFLLAIIVLFFLYSLTNQLKKQAAYRNKLKQIQNIETTDLILSKQDLEVINQRIMEEKNLLADSNEDLHSKASILEQNISELEHLLSAEREKSVGRQEEEHKKVSPRNEIYDDFLASLVTSNLKKGRVIKKIETLSVENKDKFLQHILHTFELSHPQLIEYLKERNLDKTQLYYCCCVLLGIPNKNIDEYLGIHRIYDYASAVRRKLNIPLNGRTLKNHLAEL